MLGLPGLVGSRASTIFACRRPSTPGRQRNINQYLSSHPVLSGFAAENIRDQALNIPGNLLVSIFSVKLPFRFDIRNPARFANISDGPYARAMGKGYALQALAVDSLIHADGYIGFIQARLSQLISVVDFSEASYAVLFQELECYPVVSQILRFIQGRGRAA